MVAAKATRARPSCGSSGSPPVRSFGRSKMRSATRSIGSSMQDRSSRRGLRVHRSRRRPNGRPMRSPRSSRGSMNCRAASVYVIDVGVEQAAQFGARHAPTLESRTRPQRPAADRHRTRRHRRCAANAAANQDLTVELHTIEAARRHAEPRPASRPSSTPHGDAVADRVLALRPAAGNAPGLRANRRGRSAPCDDIRYFTVEVREPRKVLLAGRNARRYAFPPRSPRADVRGRRGPLELRLRGAAVRRTRQHAAGRLRRGAAWSILPPSRPPSGNRSPTTPTRAAASASSWAATPAAIRSMNPRRSSCSRRSSVGNRATRPICGPSATEHPALRRAGCAGRRRALERVSRVQVLGTRVAGRRRLCPRAVRQRQARRWSSAASAPAA